MMKISRMLGRMSVLAASAFLVMVLSIPAMAQPGGGGGDRGGRGGQPGGGQPGGQRGGQPGGQRGGGGGFDMARMQEQMVTRTLERMELSEDETTAIKPLLTEVTKKQMDSRAGMMGRGRTGRPDGENQPADTSPAGALRKALENKDTSAKDIKAKLDAFRTDRTKKEEELKTARENLRKVLTVRQEAMLVLAGTLD